MKANAKANAKAKAKAKKKRTKFVVAWADYLGSEHKDQLGCGVFRRLYDTAEDAHKAIMDSIYYDARVCLEEQANDGDVSESEVKDFVCDRVWYNQTYSVKVDMTDIEYVYEVEEIEV